MPRGFFFLGRNAQGIRELGPSGLVTLFGYIPKHAGHFAAKPTGYSSTAKKAEEY